MALFVPVVTVTLAGTVMLVLLLASVTVRGLEVAAVSVTVQSEVPGAFTIAGEQTRLLG
ncbi:MAG: hypothetical protein M3O20_04280 [Acidobacteriota bacterium]|nr:hypothetical protein [Acidobacteriota bacterium]